MTHPRHDDHDTVSIVLYSLKRFFITMLYSYFCKLLNNNAINKTLKDSIMGKLEGILYTETMSVSTEEVTETISKLKKVAIVRRWYLC